MGSNVICDLYLKQPVHSEYLGFLSVFDKGFSSEARIYGSGYLGVNVERIRLVTFVVELRRNGFEAMNVPVAYRDNPNISREEAFCLAKDYAALMGRSVAFEGGRVVDDSPLFWAFSMVGGSEERAGGVVYIDKLDGHVWGVTEYDEYMHDYCGLLV